MKCRRNRGQAREREGERGREREREGERGRERLTERFRHASAKAQTKSTKLELKSKHAKVEVEKKLTVVVL